MAGATGSRVRRASSSVSSSNSNGAKARRRCQSSSPAALRTTSHDAFSVRRRVPRMEGGSFLVVRDRRGGWHEAIRGDLAAAGVRRDCGDHAQGVPSFAEGAQRLAVTRPQTWPQVLALGDALKDARRLLSSFTVPVQPTSAAGDRIRERADRPGVASWSTTRGSSAASGGGGDRAPPRRGAENRARQRGPSAAGPGLP